MQAFFNKFLVKIVALTAFIAVIGGAVFYYILQEFYLPILPYLLFFVASITTGVFYIVFKALGKNSAQSFNVYFMGANGAKLLLFIFFFTIYLLVFQEGIIVFSISFLTLYFVYTIFEVWALVNLVKEKARLEEINN
ncbi:MAG: hypothetical protein KAI79_00150 [Bacteroidales bacterium]|nr:hypothetical protein [Bacteroidales bacterium]